MNLTEHDRFIIHRARELTAPGVTTGEAWQRLAKEVLRQLADVTERLAGDQPQTGEGHFPDGDPRDDAWIGGYRPGIEGD